MSSTLTWIGWGLFVYVFIVLPLFIGWWSKTKHRPYVPPQSQRRHRTR